VAAPKKTPLQKAQERWSGAFDREYVPFESVPHYDPIDIMRVDGQLIVAQTVNNRRLDAALTMGPMGARMFDQWARNTPATDPFTWIPLAYSGVAPDRLPTIVQDQINYADLIPKAAPEPTQSAIPQNNEPDNLFESITGAVSNAYDAAWSGIQTGVRGAFSALQTLLEVPVGQVNSIYGDREAKRQVAEKYGLKFEEVEFLFPNYGNTALRLAGLGGTPVPDGVDPYNWAVFHFGQDRADIMFAAQDEFLRQPNRAGTPLQAWQDLVMRTSAGQIGNDPGLLFDPELGGSGLLPSNRIEEEKYTRAGQQYDLRTPEMKEAAAQKIENMTLQLAKRGYMPNQDWVDSINAPLAATPGRMIAQQWLDPTSSDYAVKSGIIDAGISLGLDPANYMGVGLVEKGALLLPKVLRKAGVAVPTTAREAVGKQRQVLVATDGRVKFGAANQVPSPLAAVRASAKDKTTIADLRSLGIEEVVDPARAAAEAAGTTTSGRGFYVSGQAAYNFLMGARGGRIVDDLVGMTSPTAIVLKSNRKFDIALATQLSKASTPEAVRAVLLSRMGGEIDSASGLTKFGQAPGLFRSAPIVSTFFGGAAKDSAFRQWFRLAPQSGHFDLNDTDEAFQRIEAFTRGLGITAEKFGEHMDRIINSPQDRNIRFEALTDLMMEVATKLKDENGIESARAKDLVQLFAGGLSNDARKYVAEGVALSGNLGAKLDVHKPLLEAELLGRTVALPDFRAIMRETGMLGSIERKLSGDAKVASYVLDKLNHGTSIWRMGVLVRPAYVLREIGEMNFRQGLSGYGGGFVHPAQHIGLVMSTIMAKEAATAAHRIGRAVMGHIDWEHNNKLFDRQVERRGALEGALPRTRAVAYRAIALPGQGVRTTAELAGRIPVPALLRDVEKQRVAGYKAAPVVHTKVSAGSYTTGDGHTINKTGKTWTVTGPFGAGNYPTMAAARTAIDNAAPKNVPIMQTYVDPNLTLTSVALKEGMQRLFPSMSMTMARVNGEQMYASLNRYLDTGDLDDLERWHTFMGSVHGSYSLDEASARSAARAYAMLSRDKENQWSDYISGTIDKLEMLARDSLVRDLANPNVTFDDAVANMLASPTLAGRMHAQPALLTAGNLAADARQYAKVVQAIMRKVTMNDSELYEALATRTYRGVRLEGGNKELRAFWRSKLQADALVPINQRVLPDEVKGSRFQTGDRTLTNVLDDVTEGFFNATGELSDVFSRGPLFRQAYMKRVLDLGANMSPVAKAEAVRKLRKAGDTKLAARIQKIEARGSLTVDEVDGIALGFAVKEMQRIYYDATKRQNWAFATRIAMPFAQATANTFRRWGEMSLKNPQLMYRTIKPFYAGTQPGSAVIYDMLGGLTRDEELQSYYTPDDPTMGADGFFFTDKYGERRFAYPLIGQLARMVPGLSDVMQSGPMNFVSKMAGLNVAGTSIFPGVGPALTLPLAIGASEWQDEDSARGEIVRYIAPYGLPRGSTLDKVISSLAPPALDKLKKSETEDLAARAAIGLIPTLLSSGNYDVSTPSGMQRLTDDANRMAKGLTVWNAVFGAVTPATLSSNPSLWVNGDPDGHGRVMMMQSKLIQEYSKYRDTAKTPQEATALFAQDYGVAALSALIPSTTTKGPQSTNDIFSYRTLEPQAYKTYNDVIGYFFGAGDPYVEFKTADQNNKPTAYSSQAYLAQKADGDKQIRPVEDFVTEINKQLGWMLYNARTNEIDKNIVDPDTRVRARADLESEVIRKFPGWSNQAVDPGAFDKKMNLMREALRDPAVKQLRSAPYLTAYIVARESAIEDLRSQNLSGDLRTKAAKTQREALLEVALKITKEDTTGAFANAWNRLFSKEFPASLFTVKETPRGRALPETVDDATISRGVVSGSPDLPMGTRPDQSQEAINLDTQPDVLGSTP
jgi:hypothetical protein